MKCFFSVLLFLIILTINVTYAQQFVDKEKLFNDTSVINATLTLNIKNLLAKKDKEGYTFPAIFACKMGDSLNVNDHISVQVRGHFRRGYCYLPPLKLIYKDNPATLFYHLKSLKLVSACTATSTDEQNLLKEYIIYKIYNQITDKSFRVRLLNLNYKDSSGKKKTITQHAFLIEDVKDLAKRNKCEDWTENKITTRATNRQQTTIVSIFEYMIGNTDWSVPVKHNIKVIHSKTDSTAKPYIVPYDFDYTGFVNAAYAIPDEKLGIENVRQRLYRGFPRTLEELNEVLDIFKKQKANIYATINNFNLLDSYTKKDLIYYLDDFFTMINDRSQVKEIFIDHARTQ